ncbi:6-hydroxymethylpterin diphosphokinase MptE-like protein [Dysosmobacter sp. Sow4_B12]|uniref:6-hydroxymethylpterin diphosphokinase MptE-like protein n=1 Tax=Dysosmobacter sp. Sow4_B12 TaxID=3438777 RepID=UPI003F90A6E6
MKAVDRFAPSVQARFVQPWQQKHFEKTRYGKRIAAYENAYAGRRCFIVANGPSLRAEDLDLLQDRGEVTFAMNRIYKLFDQTRWRPTFYVCEDELIAGGQQAEINAIPAKAKFIPIELNWYHNVRIEAADYFHLNYREEERYPFSFSTDAAHQLDCRGTVTFTCMQLASYMGFSELYLLGVDHNYQRTIDINGNVVVDPNAKDYFCEGYDADIKDIVVHDMGNNTRAYLDAKAYCAAAGGKVAIYNATRGGKLEVFPRVDFDALFTK